MKKNKYFSYLLLTAVAFFLSNCSQTELLDGAVTNSIPDLNNPTTNFFRAAYSGNSFNASTFSAVKTGSKFTVFGTKGTVGESITLTINGISPGSYNTSADIAVYNQSDAAPFDYFSFVQVGTTTTHTAIFTITAINTTTKRIAGTFDFVGYYAGPPSPPINFTNGSFEMPYSE